MSASKLYTAERFAAERTELPDRGQWAELEAGVVTSLEAPDVEHGTAVLALSKAVAEWLQREDRSRDVAVRFDVGLVLARNPDTLRFPAAAFFAGPVVCLDEDETCTDQVPKVVVEIASDAARRRRAADRVKGWLDWGVFAAIVVDGAEKSVHVLRAGRAAERHGETQTLVGLPELPGFRLEVGALFREPAWWRTPPPK